MCSNQGWLGFVQVALRLGLPLVDLFLLLGNVLAHAFSLFLSLLGNILVSHHLLELFVGKPFLLSKLCCLGSEIASKLCDILLRLGQLVQTGIHVELLVLHLFAAVIDTIQEVSDEGQIISGTEESSADTACSMSLLVGHLLDDGVHLYESCNDSLPQSTGGNTFECSSNLLHEHFALASTPCPSHRLGVANVEFHGKLLADLSHCRRAPSSEPVDDAAVE